MKKILSLLLVSLLVFALVACNAPADNTDDPANNDQTNDTQTTPTVIDFTSPATDTENFVYEEGAIVGLTAAGKTKETLTLPEDATELSADVFTGSALKNLIIGERTEQIILDNGCFNGTSKLNVYVGCTMNKVSCGNSGLLTGSTGLTLYIVAAEYQQFKNDYVWGNYSDNMKKYQ